jgi:hypothetical protein
VESNQNKNFDEWLVTHQVEKNDYFNNLLDKQRQAMKRREEAEVTDMNRVMLKFHRHDIKHTLEHQLTSILQMKHDRQRFQRKWKALLVIMRYLKNYQHRFMKY